MKETINVVVDEKDNSAGGINLHVSKLDELSNGSVESLACLVLDIFKFEDRVALIHTLIKKMKNKGTLTLKFLDAYKVAVDYIGGSVSSNKLSDFVSQKQSLMNKSDVLSIVANYNFLTVTKQYNSNYDAIIVINKEI